MGRTVASVLALLVVSFVPTPRAQTEQSERWISETIRLPGIGRIAAITVDRQRNVYIVGGTSDPSFPTTPGAFNRKCGSDGECGATFGPNAPRSRAFVMKLRWPDRTIEFSTFLAEMVIFDQTPSP
jgi:hypothetical protein